MADAKKPEKPRDPKKAFLWGLKGNVTEEYLRQAMEPAAKGEAIVSISIVPDKDPDYPGCMMAFVECKDETTAALIIDLLNGKTIPEIADGRVKAALAFDNRLRLLTEEEAESIARRLAANPHFVKKCQGQKGESGKDGAPGQKGDKGDPGPVGPQGPKGTDGAKGPAGANGQNGPQGPQGKDAPQWPSWVLVAIALVALIIASYAACGSSHGEQGPRGVQGQIGPQGPQGPQGQIGPQGEPGTAAPTAAPTAPEAEDPPATTEPPPAAPAADEGHRGPRVVADRFDNVERRFHAIDERLDALENARH
ncbi:MAG: hypothetical protein WC348_04440 [Patescibacteria group bacterium]|jgi:hypothetical protein